MRPCTTRLLVVVLALSVILAGCGASAATTGPPAPTPTPTPAPTPTPPPPTSPVARELQASGKNLDAGRYTRRGFVPRVTFAVTGSWRAVELNGGFFDVQKDVGTPDAIAIQFARPDGIYKAAGQLLAPTTAQAAADAMNGNPALTVLGTSASLIGGHSGVVVEVENSVTSTDKAQVVHVPPGPLEIPPGRRLWIAFVETPEGLVAIMVAGSVAKWEAAMAAAEPVLESVTIGI